MAYGQPSSASFSTQTLELPPKVARRSANFHPSVWGDHFLTHHASDFETIDASMDEQLREMKDEVRKMLVAAAENPTHQLNLIDQIQRLGVSYHFEHEIDVALQHAYDTYCDQHDDHNGKDDDDDLHTLALRFRLLRQQGHNISSDVFKKLKDGEGIFKGSLRSDARGLLSLYEATHMRVHGEEILEEALVFTTNHLESMIPNLSKPLAAQVAHALNQPIRKGLARLEARRYIPLCEEDYSYNELLSNFAKSDFNTLQKLHQRELSYLTRWWKDLNFTKKLSFARDRMVECYFWILGVYFEPQYCLGRKILTKVTSLISVIDDIYDVYGTLEELILFTDAIERWDMGAIDDLPEYMRECYRALLDVYSEMEEELASEGRSYCVHYAKAAMKRLIRAYFVEAKWFHEGYVPTIDEYMQVALVSGAYIVLATTSYVGMRENFVTKESFDWVSNDPLILRACCLICRLMDDMAGHEDEQERGDVASVVECYMKQYGASKQEAHAIFEKQVMNAWKDINQEFLRPTTVPMPLLTRVLNLARVINLLYKDGDGYTNAKTRTKDLITSMLVDSVTI